MKARLLAYAKLNLSLRVLGKRDDGYHEVESVVQTVSLADVIDIELTTASGVDCLPTFPGGNIAERAALLLLDRKKSSQGIRIRITKQTPMGAGLGGGSSDAAAVLVILNRWVEPLLPRSDLHAIAAELGSDVPLFLDGGCQRVSGRGEHLAACPLREEAFVILVPPVHCSTRDVYGAWMPAHEAPPPSTTGGLGRNDLYRAALRVVPSLAIYSRAIDDLSADYAGMTGSGAAFYAAFSQPEAATTARAELATKHAQCHTFLCRTVPTGSLRLEQRETHADRY